MVLLPNYLRYKPHPLKVEMHPLVLDCEKTYRTGRAGDHGAGIAQNSFSKALCAWLSR
jgi:hypothetical protein